MRTSLLTFLIVSLANFCITLSDEINFNLDITTSEMIRKEGYKAEEHIIITDDGYILTVYRIVGPPGSKAVFIQHGFLSNSFDWVILGKHKSLAFILADQGYDVWLGNARGNTYSRKHIIYNTSTFRYWNFSWHEMGIYDLPAVITYITNIKNDKLIYIGHSMGNTMFYVMAILRPDISKKVKVIFSLSPVASMYHIKSPIRYLSPINKQLEEFLFRIKMFEGLPQNILFKYLYSQFCSTDLSVNNRCYKLFDYITGMDHGYFNFTLLPLLLQHTPAGFSIKTFIHYLQLGQSEKFYYYNYGKTKNLKIYNSTEPPEYDLSKMEVPTGIFWSDDDIIANPVEVQRFYNSIPNKILNYRIPRSNFTHTGFIWATDACEIVFPKLLSVMENYR